MARPKTRVVKLDPEKVEILKRTFEKPRFAWRQLQLDPALPFPTFYLVWRGRDVTWEQRQVVIAAYEQWQARSLEYLNQQQGDAASAA
jgi:hypothetical protein